MNTANETKSATARRWQMREYHFCIAGMFFFASSAIGIIIALLVDHPITTPQHWWNL